MPRSLRRIGSRVARILTVLELSLGGVLLLVILALVFLQATQRHLPMPSLPWTGEVSRFALAWLTFAIAGVLVSRQGHITLEVVDLLPKPRLVRSVQIFALLVVATTAAALTVEAWNLVQTQGALRSPVLGISMAVVYLPILLGMASAVLRSLAQAVSVALRGPVATALEQETAAS